MAKRFIPRQFGKNPKHLFNFGTMSMVYWDLSEEFRAAADTEFKLGRRDSRFVIPAIIMYCSSVEALINEQLALQEGRTNNAQTIKNINDIKDKQTKHKIELAFDFFASNSPDEKLAPNALNDFKALLELRNAFVHFKPDWDANLYEWPARIRDAYNRSKHQPEEADWPTSFRTKKVLEWVEKATRAILEEFLRVTDADRDRFFNL